MKTVVIFGAGASKAEAEIDKERKKKEKIVEKNLPPLDSSFFKQAKELKKGYYKKIRIFLLDVYGINIDKVKSFEFIYNLIYLDSINTKTSSVDFKSALDDLNNLTKGLIRTTTNEVKCNNPLGICGLLRYLVNDYPKNDLDIITFNYDLLVERSLDRLQGSGKCSSLFDIKQCYTMEFHNYFNGTQAVHDSFANYMLGESINIYKLHGSLNWYIDKNKLYLIEDKYIFADIDFKDVTTNKNYHLKPMIVPPTFDKKEFYSDLLNPSWKAAQQKLTQADRVIIFGYSLPDADLNAHSMFLKAFSKNKKIRIDIIDTDKEIKNKYIDKLQIEDVKTYKSVLDFVKQNK